MKQNAREVAFSVAKKLKIRLVLSILSSFAQTTPPTEMLLLATRRNLLSLEHNIDH